MTERPLVFDCGDDPLIGVLHEGRTDVRAGVVIIVGGPQYRVGSHRQFVLLARALAKQGVPCFRFDFRGMGDSAAEMRDFRAVDRDIRAAIDVFLRERPGLERVVLWGLCDGASAALIYARSDERVDGVVAVNPWVRSETTLAQARVRHYYVKRLLEPQLWKKVVTGRIAWRKSLSAAASALRMTAVGLLSTPRAEVGAREEGFQTIMARGWQKLRGRVLFIASGNDLTAQEFLDHACRSRDWQPFSRDMPGQLAFIAGADHTFSTCSWNDELINLTTNWVLPRLKPSQEPEAHP